MRRHERLLDVAPSFLRDSCLSPRRPQLHTMPHCNNPNAKKRKAGRNDPTKPKFLQRKANKPAAVPPTDADPDADPVALAPTPAVKVPRSEKAAIITEYHALEKQLASCSDPLEKRMLLARQMEIGGLQAYQEASLHGGDKKRGGESGKWCVTQLKELKVGVDKGKGKAATGYKVVDGVKVYPKVVREKVGWRRLRRSRRWKLTWWSAAPLARRWRNRYDRVSELLVRSLTCRSWNFVRRLAMDRDHLH